MATRSAPQKGRARFRSGPLLASHGSGLLLRCTFRAQFIPNRAHRTIFSAWRSNHLAFVSGAEMTVRPRVMTVQESGASEGGSRANDANPLHAFWICQPWVDFAHVPMVYGGHLTIVPCDRDSIPTRSGDTAAISGIASPAYSIAFLELLRFGGGHVAPSLFCGPSRPLPNAADPGNVSDQAKQQLAGSRLRARAPANTRNNPRSPALPIPVSMRGYDRLNEL